MNGQIVVLATPEIAGLPYVISGLVAAGGLAAAMSTADGLLLAIANALSHDLVLQDHRSKSRQRQTTCCSAEYCCWRLVLLVPMLRRKS